MLIEGIILFIIGVILLAISSYVPSGGRTITKIGGIILAILGLALIVISLLFPAVGTGSSSVFDR